MNLRSPVFEKIAVRRQFKSRLMIGILGVAACIAVLPLVLILFYVVREGFGALNWAYFTELPKPVGEVGGGIANAIVGSFTIVLMAALVGVPWGISLGVYLSEYSHHKLSKSLRVAIDNLASIPSIIVGLFAYALFVLPMKRFSALAGAASLALIMIPVVARTTEELLKLVPQHVREAGLALGIPRWRMILSIVVKGNLGGLFTGVVLGVARVAGETAPLIFTAFGNQFWSRGLDQPTSSLPVQIYTYAISPYEDWHQKAWAGALVLVFSVLVMNGLTRLWLSSRLRTK